MKTLLQHANKVFARDALMDKVYAHNVFISDRTIDSHIRGIRTRFSEVGCSDVIQTVHRVGYKLGSCL